MNSSDQIRADERAARVIIETLTLALVLARRTAKHFENTDAPLEQMARELMPMCREALAIAEGRA